MLYELLSMFQQWKNHFLPSLWTTNQNRTYFSKKIYLKMLEYYSFQFVYTHKYLENVKLFFSSTLAELATMSRWKSDCPCVTAGASLLTIYFLSHLTVNSNSSTHLTQLTILQNCELQTLHASVSDPGSGLISSL